jgi:hypothetical protein
MLQVGEIAICLLLDGAVMSSVFYFRWDLFLRTGDCNQCGFSNKFPPCPDLLATPEKISCRVLSSSRKYIMWLEDQAMGRACASEAPARRKELKVDALVAVVVSVSVFLQYLGEKMDRFAPHCFVQRHQLLSRAHSIANVAAGRPGERLEILVDWSEKLSLEPNNSATGASYAKIGVIVAVCVWKPADGAALRTETWVGLCKKPTNDVPHTHAFLRSVVAGYAQRSAEHKSLGPLKHVNIWSDGGQSHFKCAEGFVFASHLLRELRGLRGASKQCSLQWNFMQSYHGKGPYDAEVMSRDTVWVFCLLTFFLSLTGRHCQILDQTPDLQAGVRICGGKGSL